MEAIRCKGLTAADGEKSSGGRIELPNGELAELPAEIPADRTISELTRASQIYINNKQIYYRLN